MTDSKFFISYGLRVNKRERRTRTSPCEECQLSSATPTEETHLQTPQSAQCRVRAAREKLFLS